jgi:alkylation response protein AidB-like acyl-CoA dehydrogenase
MTALLGPPSVRELEMRCRAAAHDLRSAALAIDADPDSISDYLNLEAVEMQRLTLVPPAYQDRPLRVAGHAYSGMSCLERTITQQRLAYGDPGVILASPGPSLSGVAVLTLGDEEQQDFYFRRMMSAPTWTFFGLTEPAKGSAAAELETRLDPAPDANGWLLSGTKRYVGNAARAQLGVVFARRARGPIGIEAVLLDTSSPGVSARLLPTVGLRGARLSEITFDRVRIAPEMVLGRRWRPSRRGLLGAVQTLLRFRPGLGAMALGVTEALCDHVTESRPGLRGWQALALRSLRERTAALTRMTRDVAEAVDSDRIETIRLTGQISTVKLRSVRIAEEASLFAADVLEGTSLLDDPWLDKTFRDVRAFEFMEGAGAIHQMAVFHSVLKGQHPAGPGPRGLGVTR